MELNIKSWDPGIISVELLWNDPDFVLDTEDKYQYNSAETEKSTNRIEYIVHETEQKKNCKKVVWQPQLKTYRQLIEERWEKKTQIRNEKSCIPA